MPDPRRIVPDASVLLATFFREPWSRRAKPIVDAIRCGSVVTFAPENLAFEFTARALSGGQGRGAVIGLGAESAVHGIEDFLSFSVSVHFVPWQRLVRHVMRLTIEHGIAAPDAWYLACAMAYDAELWILDRQRDRFVEHARNVYRGVFVSADSRFDA